MHLVSFHISYEFEYIKLNYNFLDSDRLQGTHIDALSPFNSKLMTLIPRGGL